MGPREILLIFLLTVLASAAGWFFLRGDTENGPAQKPAAATAADDSLNDLLADADLDPQLIEVFEALQREIDAGREARQQLSAQLAALESRLMAVDSLEQLAGAGTEADIEEAGDGSDARTGARDRGPPTRERLIDAGFAPHQAEDILTTADRIAMQRLELQYQAQREGWMRSREYVDAMREIPSIREALTEEYGETAYDRYLYASGQPNRLVVNDVFRDSPAASAGLQPGDRIIALAGERIYSQRDLRQVATAGSADETVSVVVQRGGSSFEVYLPRGPLGVRTSPGYDAPGT